MIITAGRLRGRKIESLKGIKIRPTSSKVRQAIFNVLFSMGFNLESKKILDLFAGSGAMSFESISRGALFSTLVDISSESIELLKTNIKKLDLLESTSLLKNDCLNFVKNNSIKDFDMIFMDPPYDYPFYLDIVKSVLRSASKSSVLIVESSKTNAKKMEDMDIKAVKVKNWGDSFVSFFVK